MFDFNIDRLLYVLPVVIIALSFHEYAHALVAYKLGDPTAKNQGRLSLNPLKHLDPLGTILLIFASFGWAKPVPINPMYFNGDRRKGTLYVSLAGIVMNLFLAVVTTACLSLIIHFAPNNTFWQYAVNFCSIMIQMNLVLAVFNFLPVPPLDGSKIFGSLLPPRFIGYMYQMEKYGFLILLLLMLTGVLSKIINPVITGLMWLLLKGFGIN